MLQRVSNCRFSDADWKSFEELWGLESFAQSKMGDLRAKAMLAPQAVPTTVVRMLAEFEVGSDEADSRKLPWRAEAVCKAREHFRGSVLQFRDGDADRHFLVVYAEQSPQRLCLMLLKTVGELSYGEEPSGGDRVGPNESDCALHLRDLLLHARADGGVP